MAEEITKEVFAHLVSLAALELNEQEGEYLRQQLNNQLKAIHELGAIPLDEDVPPARHGVPFPRDISPALRKDVWHPFADPQLILDQAPQTTDNFYVVPDIPHTKLD